MAVAQPGKMYVEKYGTVESLRDVLQYVEFLRNEAELSVTPPIDLGKIYKRFGLPEPEPAPIDQQALLLDAETGLILLREDDPRVRQRFSEAHELIEMLISALPIGRDWNSRQHGIFKPKAKEEICNAAAAELLMPSVSFAPLVRTSGVSFETARKLATKFWVSTTASLRRVVELAPGCHAVVLWEFENKPTEIEQKVSVSQTSFLDSPTSDLPPKQLRVSWSFKRPPQPIIPKHKSVPEASSIFQAWQSGVDTSKEERLNLGPIQGLVRSENHPFSVQEGIFVLSLLHLPGDSKCGLEE